jgi:hypothetical protein
VGHCSGWLLPRDRCSDRPREHHPANSALRGRYCAFSVDVKSCFVRLPTCYCGSTLRISSCDSIFSGAGSGQYFSRARPSDWHLTDLCIASSLSKQMSSMASECRFRWCSVSPACVLNVERWRVALVSGVVPVLPDSPERLFLPEHIPEPQTCHQDS